MTTQQRLLEDNRNVEFSQSPKPKSKLSKDIPITIDLNKSSRLRRDSIERMMDKTKAIYACEFGCTLSKKSDADIAKTNKARRQLFLASIFCFLFMIAELLGGYFAHSLALMSDATHLLSDFAGLMISIFALYLTQKESTDKLSFGYHRAEIIGALFSVFLIWGLTIWLVYEAINRLITPEEVDGEIMFIIACCGVAVNVIMGVILHQGGVHHHHGLPGSHDHGHDHGDHDHGHEHEHEHEHEHNHKKDKHKHNDDHNHAHDEHNHKKDKHKHNDDHNHAHDDHNHNEHKNINVRSAFIHALGDLLQSFGVLIAASLIWYDSKTFRIADPICTLIFSVIVVFTTISLVRDALDVLMEGVPKNIDIAAIEQRLRQVNDVADVHDLHVWNLSLGKPALSVHLLAKSNSIDTNGNLLPVCLDGILLHAQNICRDEFGIYHSTIQLEWPHLYDQAYVRSTSPNQLCRDYCQHSLSNHDVDDKHKHQHSTGKASSFQRHNKTKSHKHDDHDHDHDDHKHHDHDHDDQNHDHDQDHDHNHDHDDHGHDHDDHGHDHDSNHNHDHDNHNHNHNHNHDHDKHDSDNENEHSHSHSDHSDHNAHDDLNKNSSKKQNNDNNNTQKITSSQPKTINKSKSKQINVISRSYNANSGTN